MQTVGKYSHVRWKQYYMSDNTVRARCVFLKCLLTPPLIFRQPYTCVLLPVDCPTERIGRWREKILWATVAMAGLAVHKSWPGDHHHFCMLRGARLLTLAGSSAEFELTVSRSECKYWQHPICWIPLNLKSEIEKLKMKLRLTSPSIWSAQ